MLSYLRSFSAPVLPAIGIDCGSRRFKAVQVRNDHGRLTVSAAAAAPVPEDAPGDPVELARYFREVVRPLLSSEGFAGKRVALAVPAHWMHLAAFRKAPGESPCDGAAAWLPFHESQALVRNVDAGEVHEEDGRRREIVSLAVRRDVVVRYTSAAASAGLEVTSVVSEPDALLAALTLAGADSRLMRLVVDLGLSGTRVYAAIGRQLLFARRLRTKGAQLERAVTTLLGVGREASCDMRSALPPLDANATVQNDRLREVDEACGEHIERLIVELRHCHHYVSTVFRGTPVHHIVFVGGGAKHRRLWQRIATGVGLPARATDPLARMASPHPAPTGTGGTHSGPVWAVAAGLSISAAMAASDKGSSVASSAFEERAISRLLAPIL